MNNLPKGNVRCSVCLGEYGIETYLAQKTKICPWCGTHIEPVLVSHDGYVRVNWQDLRVLVIYAERWASAFDLSKQGNRDAIQALGNIVRKLSQYRPQGALSIDLMGDPIIEANVKKTDEHIEMKITAEKSNKIDTIITQPPDKDGNIPSPYFRGKQPPKTGV